MERQEYYEPSQVRSIDCGNSIGMSVASCGSPGRDTLNIGTQIFLRDCDTEAGFLRPVSRDSRRGGLSRCGTDGVFPEVDARGATPPYDQDALTGRDDRYVERSSGKFCHS